MSENLSPNKISGKCVENSKNKCELSCNERKVLIDLKTELDNEVMETRRKRFKTDECVECINDSKEHLRSDSSTQLFPSIKSQLSESCHEMKDSLLTNKLIDCKDKSQLEIELSLIEDCYESDPRVVAKKTIKEQIIECESLGLVLNTDLKRETITKSSVKYSSNKFEVESIYDSGVEENTNKILYLVKWKNWGQDYNTWEPLSHLNNCRNLVDEFKYVQRLNDQDLTQIYHNFYRLQGIIEDIIEKKVDENTVLTILFIFNNISLRDYNYTKVKFREMRTHLRNCMQSMDEISKIAKIDRRMNAMKTLFNQLKDKLNILKRFSTLAQFFDFFDKRKSVQYKLNKWEKEINDIIASENEGQLIKLENYVDCEVPPQNFDYIAKCKTNNREIIVSNDPPIYCKCQNCEESQDECCVSAYELPIVYNKNGILKDSRNVRHAIYECNNKCKCGPDCINRVIQRGRKHKLAIFRTDDGKGWGVRALETIQKGSFVMEYVGEIITIEEADRRGAKYDAEGRTYLFDLDYTPDEETDLHKYAVDATQCGNVSHFVNHSCDPNLDTRVAWIENLDPFMPHIALFAVRNIKLNEELTFDYKINVHGITDKSEYSTSEKIPDSEMCDISDDSGISHMTNDKSFSANSKMHEIKSNSQLTRVTCKCGANNCRTFLY